MRKTTIVALASSLLLVLVHPAGAITSGAPDGDRHPEVGALIREYEGTLYIWCSGTLVAPNVFLTAAHCFFGADSPRVHVSFDTQIDEPNLDPADLLAGTAYAHPDAWSGGMSDPLDIAVVMLDDPVADITPAILPVAGRLDHKALRNQIFTAVGYGMTRDTQQGGWQTIEPIDGVRRYATQSFLSLQKAWLLLSMVPAIGSGGTCYGDSGGPHFLGGPDSHTIASITVTGDTWCKATDKTYRLDTPAARDFLDDFGVPLP